MDRKRFVREATSVGIATEQAAILYERLYSARDRPASGSNGQPGRLLLGAIWFGIGLVVAASAWWATLLDAPSATSLALLSVWLVGFAVAAEYTFRRGPQLLCGGLALIAIGYVVAIAGIALDLAGAEPDSFSDPEPLAGSAACLVLSTLVLARYRRPVLTLAVALAGSCLVGGLLDLLIGDTASALVAGCSLVGVGVLLDLLGWRRFAIWMHLVGACVVAATVFDRWDDPASAFVLALAAGTLGLALARVGYLVAAIGLLVWATGDVAPPELIPVLALVFGVGVLAGVTLLVRRGNPLQPWLERHDLRRRQRDLAI